MINFVKMKNSNDKKTNKQTHTSRDIREQWLKRMIRACMVSSRARPIYSVQSRNNKHTQKQGLLREGMHGIIQGPPGPAAKLLVIQRADKSFP